jgi:hypothetical protein
VIQVKYEVTHPRYNPSYTDNDFNLIFLRQSVDAPVVKLNKESSVPAARDPVIVMGWVSALVSSNLI